MLTQSRLKEVLSYDPESGDFTWIKKRKGGTKVGDIAGGMSQVRYWRISIDYGRYQCHRLAFLYMTGHWPTLGVDHIDHDRTNNKWQNLRDVLEIENHKNMSKNRNNTSGATGVGKSPSGKWRAHIGVNGDFITLGTYDDFDDAVAARKQANEKYGFHPNHGV